MAVWVGREKGCDYATIREAVERLERRPGGVHDTLVLLPGTYREQVEIHRSNLSIVGIGRVEIVMDRHAREKGADGEEIGTFATPTLFLGGSGLLVENVTVANSAGQGEEVGQAVALSAYCDRAVFRSCTFKGHQDTLFTGPLPPSPKKRVSFGGIQVRQSRAQHRQLYQNCRIEGTVDYIFGGASAFFEHCELHSVARTGPEAAGYVTAASTPENQEYGFVFRDCLLTAGSGVAPASVYLGRPWRAHAKTVFAGCRTGDHIHPAGWHDWGDPANERTADYREYVEEASRLSSVRASWAIRRPFGEEDWSKERMFGNDRFWEELAWPERGGRT
ncbi:pectinesterase family protein [Saccharibacillus alkalitolerans]|uniref:Pectinesterase n=1 Tax=Saccharibacillus alkalitolerans TaxID=2705290 RepID=A0ABX0F1C5_9BACL|nr:pectinesterase family protein [Saccharibacillus alkalitolerans]NGZ74315.1 pectin methylesterase [Saccharibacillus alkalitolerans]